MDDVEGAIEGTVGLTFELAHVLLWSGIGFLVGFVAAVLVTAVGSFVARRRAAVGFIRRRTRTALMFIGAVVGTWSGFLYATQLPAGSAAPGWRGAVQHVLLILVILGGVWLVASLIRAAEDVVLDRLGDDRTSGKARRVQTQSQIIRRVAVAVVVVLGIAAVLLTFPGARAAGASLLASAGIASVVAGLAAQSTLGSVFAGIQIAMTDALRVDDNVFVEGEFGKIEEITLTYVVVCIWDGRRIVLPSTYFTSQPFENWTRRESELLGGVELDVDWRVPVAAMRAEMERVLEGTELWDRRMGVFQVMDATGGMVRVRALVSAKDALTRADLLHYLRERLVLWLQEQAPYALPRTRFEEQRVEVVDDSAVQEAQAARQQAEQRLAERDELEDSLTGPPVRQEPEAVRAREALARRARRHAEREDRRRARANDGHIRERKPRRSRAASAASAPSAAEAALEETVLLPPSEGTGTTGAQQTPEENPAAIYTGSPENEARAEAFSGPGEEVYAERAQEAERRAEEETVLGGDAAPPDRAQPPEGTTSSPEEDGRDR